MKIGNNLYQCPWCGTKIEHVKRTAGAMKGQEMRGGVSKGHSRVSDQLICPECKRYVKQK